MTALPPDRFYWALLDTSRLPRRLIARGPSRRQLGYLLEPFLPVPLESVHAAYRRVGAGRVVACAADCELLRTSLDAEAQALIPHALPPFLHGAGLSTNRLNLLTGRFESRRRRARRRSGTLVACVVIVLVSMLLVVGMERRVLAARTEARQARAATDAALARVFPTPSAQPGELRLVAELRRLRAAGPPADRALPDASESLAAVLAHWPAVFDGRVESLIVAPGTITATAVLADHARAQQLAAAVSRVSGWSWDQPQVRADRSGVRAVIRLTRRQEASP